MLTKILTAIIGLGLAAAVAVGFYVLRQDTKVVEVPEIAITPQPAPLDAEISDRLVARLISEDEDIQSALTGAIPLPATTEVAVATEEKRTDKDILFELMANWVYVKYRKVNQLEEAQFRNTMNSKVTPYIKVGGTLDSAKIVKLDSDRATVSLGEATQDLFYIPLKPPRIDPSVPRTPEQIALAQRIYYETVYKSAKVMGEKYNKAAGRPREMKLPPREEQYEQANNYLDLMEQRLDSNGGAEVPQEAIVDPQSLTQKQRELYDTYLRTIKRTPEEIRAAIEEQREKIRERQNSSN